MRTVSRIILGGVLAVLLGFSPASAEWYVSGYAGLAIPNNQDADTTGSIFGLSFAGTLKDVDLDTSAVFGGKVGYFFEDWPYFGLELEGYHFSPDADPQTVQASGTIGGAPFSGPLTLSGADIGVTGIAVNAILRGMTGKSDAFPEGRFHGYIGVGPGLFISNLEALVATQTDDDTSTVLGGQVLAGLKFFLTEHLSLFGEYKFIFTDKFEFELSEPGVSTTYKAGGMTNLIYGGIAYHF